ncbi:plastocyanin/azurin family copper-binding protein [Fodinibius sediminis]|uniref:Azurin n=1 Tax=Fodinibius sediminis TaxID=1214077 RepID=A0A521BKC9_9BACT|nr:plastocyanin/azurin family copper-binding protein [Fodinibius sediminis]SMO47532.1 azurin [Fodinibius sediminis]
MMPITTMINKGLLPVIAVLLLFGAAFGPVNNSSEPRTIEIVGSDHMKFDVTSIDAAPGEEIRIVLTTESNLPKMAMAHNVVVLDDETDIQKFVSASAKARDNQYIADGFEDQIIAATDLAGGGETVEVTFTAPEEPGTYEYICSFPGHYASGMKGVLNVE